MKLPSISRITSSLKEILQRFPFLIFTTLLLFVISVLYVHRTDLFQIKDSVQNNFSFEDTLLKVSFILTLGLALHFAIHTFCERRKSTITTKLLLNGLAMIGFVIFYFMSNEMNTEFGIRLVCYGVGVHMLASVLAFWNEKNPLLFWKFNKDLFLRFLLAALFSNVLFAGIAGAIGSFDALFTVDVPSELYIDLFLLLLIVFNTFFFLGGIPKLDESYTADEINYPKSLKIFTQFVLLPLVVIYLLIMYAYTVKILFLWDWPRGMLTYMILGYSITGMLALLLLHPIQNLEGNRWIKIFSNWFYRALLPLVAVLGVAIFKRVSDYGITEERYFVIVLSVWLLCISLYFSFSKAKNIKFIPISLFILSFVTTVGPWGAFSVSQSSQLGRLENILVQNKLLTDGKLVKGSYDIPNKDYTSLTSILDFFNRDNEKGSGMYQQFLWGRVTLPDSLRTLYNSNPYGLLVELVIKPIPDGTDYSNNSRFNTIGLNNSNLNYADSLPYVYTIKDYNYFSKCIFYISTSDSNAVKSKTFITPTSVIKADYYVRTGIFTFTRQSDSVQCTFDLKTYYSDINKLKEIEDASSIAYTSEELYAKKIAAISTYTIEKISDNKSFSVKLLINSINGSKEKNDIDLYDIDILVQLK